LFLLTFRRNYDKACSHTQEVHATGSAVYFIAVLASTIGSSTALAPDAPCSIETVAF
jgi:hypothetical protein